jgi:hypothetical protein
MRLLTVRQFAKKLNVGDPYIYYNLGRGAFAKKHSPPMPSHSLGGRPVFDESMLPEWEKIIEKSCHARVPRHPK